ncbi:MAG: GUN4 domain-containing protein [Cyanobacteria bacterium P01_C01_bin.121]
MRRAVEIAETRMAKVALLIGVSEYGQGLTNLPGTQADLSAMEQVLRNPKIGAFDEVQVLPNPNRTQMEMAIEDLFSRDRHKKDDLILLYFSGHGVKDDDGAFYLATCITEKNDRGKPRTSTAVSSSALHSYIEQSRSRRKVLILDCCFSGAIADGMKAKAVEETVEIQQQLGGEGRAILTSSTATQYSFENPTGELSIYTQYLVEGLRTGAAASDEDGQITVEELHDYAKEKVQEAAPRMKPEIYPVKEGYRIFIAQAAQGDPKRVLRKEVEGRAKLTRGKLLPAERRAFNIRARQLDLKVSEAEQIIQEVLRPYEAFWENLKEFEEAVQDTVEYDPQLNEASIDSLRYLQRVMKLRDEDIAEILNIKGISLDAPPAPTKTQSEPALPIPKAVKATQASEPETEVEEILLESEKGIDYSKLRDLLAAQDWKAADQETYLRMLEVVGRKDGDWIRAEELKPFSHADLKTIDRLWVHYSNGHFGFSVQKQIYVECGAKLDGKYPGDKIWKEFCDCVGWRKGDSYLNYSSLKKDPRFSPRGELLEGIMGVE